MEEEIDGWRIVISENLQTPSKGILPVISILMPGEELNWDGVRWIGTSFSSQPWWIVWEEKWGNGLRPECSRETKENYPPEVWNLACEMIRRMKKLRSFQ